MKRTGILLAILTLVCFCKGQETFEKKLIGTWQMVLMNKDGVYYNYETNEEGISDTALKLKKNVVMERKANMFIQIMKQSLPKVELSFLPNGDFIEKMPSDELSGKFSVREKLRTIHLDYNSNNKTVDLKFEFTKEGLLLLTYPQSPMELGNGMQIVYKKNQ